jgi:hypothetical protein
LKDLKLVTNRPCCSAKRVCGILKVDAGEYRTFALAAL